MNDAIRALLETFGPLQTRQEEDNALQEILQRITLLGLHRAGFFDRAAFYGGTALRILYGLNRFSEDLDFCLLTPDENFTLQPFFETIEAELERFGFQATLSQKRTGPEVAIESTFQGLIAINLDPKRAHPTELVKIRLEVDKHNPAGAVTCQKLIKLPIPFMVRTLGLSSLFAGKLHAVLARAYLNRVKGRDYYDLAYFLARSTPVNLAYIESKLRDSATYTEEVSLTLPKLVRMLKEKFQEVDFEKAKQDVLPFIRAGELADVEAWSAELFCALIETLTEDEELENKRASSQ